MTQRTVLVTGAAAGIGRATALAFAREGWQVGACDIDDAGLAGLVASASGLSGAIHPGHLDVADAAAFSTRVDELVAATGRLDVLVNNAGILLDGEFAQLDVEQLHREVEVNVKGTLNGAHAAFLHLRRSAHAGGSPVLVNLASASAIHGQAELANYSATKFYIRGLTEALDLEWERHGIRVVALWPLFVQTPMTEGLHTGTTESLGIHLSPEDVAAAVLRAVQPGVVAQALHQVHYPVGIPARAMALGSRFSPAWLTRRVNKRLGQGQR